MQNTNSKIKMAVNCTNTCDTHTHTHVRTHTGKNKEAAATRFREENKCINNLDKSSPLSNFSNKKICRLPFPSAGFISLKSHLLYSPGILFFLFWNKTDASCLWNSPASLSIEDTFKKAGSRHLRHSLLSRPINQPPEKANPQNKLQNKYLWQGSKNLKLLQVPLKTDYMKTITQ